MEIRFFEYITSIYSIIVIFVTIFIYGVKKCSALLSKKSKDDELTDWSADVDDSFEPDSRILNICFWNVNGLDRRKVTIGNFLNEENIDVMLLAETHLTNKHHFYIPNYKFYQTRHPDGKAHGGTGILIKCGIKHHVLDEYAKDYLQATSINLNIGWENMTLAAVYSTGSYGIEEFQWKDLFDKLGDRFLAAGDYNAKHELWHSLSNNSRGKTLSKIINCNQNGFSVVSQNQPTYMPADQLKTPDIIDFAITKGIDENFVTARLSYNLLSDHYAILYCLGERKAYPDSNSAPQFKLASPDTNRLMYKNFIESHLQTNHLLESENSIDDFDDCVHDFNIMLALAAKLGTPRKQRSYSRVESFINYEIEHAVIENLRRRKEWQEFKFAARRLWEALQLEKKERKLKKRRKLSFPAQ